jgi:hypothetical protein
MRFSFSWRALAAAWACAGAALVGSCQGGGAGAGGAATTTASGGNDTGAGFFDAGGTAWSLPDGCGGPPASDAASDGPTGCEGIEGGVTYHEVGIILAGCQGEGCHESPTAQDLVGIVAAECCDGRLLVAPGNAAQSYLLDKVLGQDLCYPGRMPLNQTPLSDAEILTIRRWICEGAPGN